MTFSRSLKTFSWSDASTLDFQFAALGGFILLFGFLAFNGGSLGSISNPGDGAIIAAVVVNTIVAGTGGAFITLLLNKTGWFGDRKWSLLVTLNGCLTGMVRISHLPL